jgi:hypothetical protein
MLAVLVTVARQVSASAARPVRLALLALLALTVPLAAMGLRDAMAQTAWTVKVSRPVRCCW